MTFFCAIDNGLVLTLAECGDIYDSNLRMFDSIEENLGEIEGCLLFECALRKLEILELPDKDILRIEELYKKYKTSGLYTYGEQSGGLHINQTLTGVAFGK